MRRSVRLAVVVGLVVTTVAGGTAALAPGAGSPATQDSTGDIGPQVAAFTGSTSAATSSAVDQGMWTAAFKRANESERARLVSQRVRTLERRMTALNRERAAAANVSGAAASARLAAVDSRASALAAASERAAAVAERRGMSEEAAALRGLKRRAERVDRGVEIDQPDEPREEGPPDEAGDAPGGDGGDTDTRRTDGDRPEPTDTESLGEGEGGVDTDKHEFNG